MRRALSLIVALAMLTPALAAAVEAAVATWLSPPAGQLITGGKAEISVGFNTQSEMNVTHLDLYVDGRFYARKVLTRPTPRGVSSFVWDCSRAARGTHDLVVKVFAGNTFIIKVTGSATVGTTGGSFIDTRPPVVVFSNIKSGQVLRGLAKVNMDASDDSGQPPMVSFLVDNSLKMLRNTPPYSYELNTTSYRDGDHELQTYAYDTAGNRSDPAVVKVSFQNNLQRPTVAAMSVNRDPITVTDDDGTVVTVPADVIVPTAPKLRGTTVARAAGPGVGLASAPPAVALAEPAPKPVVAAAAPKRVSQATSAAPRDVAVSRVVSKLRAETDRSPTAVGSGRASEPTADVPESAPSEAAAASEPKLVAMSPASDVRSATVSVLADGASAAPPESVSAPVVAESKDVAVARQSSKVRVGGSTGGAPGQVSAPPVSDEMVVASEPKNVKVALLPDVRSWASSGGKAPSIASPPPTPSSRKARLEKSTVPTSGKVRVRNLFENLGGVVFWDPISHTVTAYAGDMRLELRIGSNTALVNGKRFTLDGAPYIVGGRTIIDAQVFHRAYALMAGSRSASAN